jgi:hypothetical protein
VLVSEGLSSTFQAVCRLTGSYSSRLDTREVGLNETDPENPPQTLDSLLPSKENVGITAGSSLIPPLKDVQKEGGTWNV